MSTRERPPLTATYRVQFSREFTLRQAMELVPRLHALGISHLYASPLLAARAGSTHGYDVVDHSRLNPELGTEADLGALAAALHALGMGMILDIVPNHMGVARENRQWEDVLEHGARSRFANWFDVDRRSPRSRGRIVLPVLGDALARVLARGEITLVEEGGRPRLKYFDHSWPVDATTLPLAPGPDGMRALLARQHYVPAHWKRAPQAINYRRFFDVNDLVAIRIEDDSVFEAVHAKPLEWVRAGILDGLRVDHVDGLREPRAYLERLRDRAGVPVWVEKILAPDERLPLEWPVAGATGYESLNDLDDLFVDAAGFAAIESWYRSLRRLGEATFADIAWEGRRRVLTSALAADVSRLARLLPNRRGAREAIVALCASMPVYRSYIEPPGAPSVQDAERLERAFAGARARVRAPDVQRALSELHGVLLGAADNEREAFGEFVLRFQQTTGPATAKGVEDTALYQYVPLASRNEVGGAPDRPLSDAVSRFHRENVARLQRWPQALVATSTHDTKRSADARSRIASLSFISREWTVAVMRWRRLNAVHKRAVRGRLSPDANTEYLFYQALLSLWPAPLGELEDRLNEYMLKAAREAKLSTSWTEPDAEFEEAMKGWISAVLSEGGGSTFLAEVEAVSERVRERARNASLSRVALQLTMPGVPDIYRGDEWWSYALVDPDNRRPVNYQLPRDEKQALIARLLELRRAQPRLFSHGAYYVLDRGPDVLAFARVLDGWRVEVEVDLRGGREPRVRQVAPGSPSP
ncbi:MAG: malto-oligosyltrehalose synthase [Gemmatimonadetes bacterium]|nr:malto-oligosyltrehalose synthase [Gemmatimonadota bacterium]